MIGPDIGPGVPTASGMESWDRTTVPFATPRVEGMPGELASYLEVAQAAVEHLAHHSHDQGVVVTLEPDWDGCDGRWLNIDIGAKNMTASLCAVAVLDPERLSTKAADPAAARPLLETAGWALVVDSDRTWGYWERTLPDDPDGAAQEALAPALALFAVYEPRRWFVSINLVDEAPTSVDLRRWRARRGLEPAPPTVAPMGTEPWAILCEAGYHSMHERPCWDPDGPWPAG